MKPIYDKYLDEFREGESGGGGGGGGGGSNPGGTPVTPIPVDTSELTTDVAWQNGGIYQIEVVENMPPIAFFAPAGAAGIATFELHLAQSTPAQAIDWAVGAMDVIWLDDDGAAPLWPNPPPAFDGTNTEYTIVVRHYADQNVYYANVAYTREIEFI